MRPPISLEGVRVLGKSFSCCRHQMIPPTVYMYWHDDNLPVLAIACLRSVQRHNPQLSVKILGHADVPKEFQNMELTPKQQSNIVRLYLVSVYGGIWLDAHCICTSRLEFDMKATNLQAYCSFDGCIDNWAFAAPPNEKTVCAWFDEYAHALRYGLDKYCREARKHFVLEQELQERLPYLACYIASAYAQEKMGWISKKNAHAKTGPFYYLESRNYMRELMYGTTSAPLVKLTEPIYKRVAHALKTGRYDDNAVLPRELLSL